MDKLEEQFYSIAGEELAAKNVRQGVFAKAYALASGDEAKTKANYITLRVEQLREELDKELSRRKAEEERQRNRPHEIEQILAAVRALPYRNNEHIPDSQFDGQPTSLSKPIAVSQAGRHLNLPGVESELVIAIRSGYLKGVRHSGDWYFDLAVGVTTP